jgi:putative redox protein
MSQSNEDGLTTTIYKKIDFEGDIDEEQKNRLLVIAEKCPVSKILTNKIQIAPMPQ